MTTETAEKLVSNTDNARTSSSAVRIVCIVTAAIFLTAAFSKAMTANSFIDTIENSLSLSDNVLKPFALSVILAECLVGSALLFSPTRRIAIKSAIVLIVAFTGWIAFVAFKNPAAGCGCFGAGAISGKSELALSAVRNTLLFTALVWAHRQER